MRIQIVIEADLVGKCHRDYVRDLVDGVEASLMRDDIHADKLTVARAHAWWTDITPRGGS